MFRKDKIIKSQKGKDTFYYQVIEVSNKPYVKYRKLKDKTLHNFENNLVLKGNIITDNSISINNVDIGYLID